MRQPDRENNPCHKCNGHGWRNYGNTSTWTGGIGGQAITGGLCDECWGSGDDDVHFTDLRKMREGYELRIKEASINSFLKSYGLGFSQFRGVIPSVVDAIEKLKRKRKPTPDFWAHRAYDAIQDAMSEFLPENNADG